MSTVADLNDPFEWLSITGDKVVRASIRKLRSQLASELGFICFSRDWRHPLLWAHYADNHKGICLGFDVEENQNLRAVQYVEERKRWDELRERPLQEVLDPALNLLNTKFDAWKYESEQRMFVNLSNPDTVSNLYFQGFAPSISLKQVLVGERCTLTREHLSRVLAESHSDTESFKVRAGFQRFEMVKNQLKRAWK